MTNQNAAKQTPTRGTEFEAAREAVFGPADVWTVRPSTYREIDPAALQRAFIAAIKSAKEPT